MTTGFSLTVSCILFDFFHSTLMQQYVTWFVAGKIANVHCEAAPSGIDTNSPVL